jgi:hypothetical protein
VKEVGRLPRSRCQVLFDAAHLCAYCG